VITIERGPDGAFRLVLFPPRGDPGARQVGAATEVKCPDLNTLHQVVDHYFHEPHEPDGCPLCAPAEGRRAPPWGAADGD
jgi:hypothetical protein